MVGATLAVALGDVALLAVTLYIGLPAYRLIYKRAMSCKTMI
jgi:hypothetical protein